MYLYYLYNLILKPKYILIETCLLKIILYNKITYYTDVLNLYRYFQKVCNITLTSITCYCYPLSIQLLEETHTDLRQGKASHCGYSQRNYLPNIHRKYGFQSTQSIITKFYNINCIMHNLFFSFKFWIKKVHGVHKIVCWSIRQIILYNDCKKKLNHYK